MQLLYTTHRASRRKHCLPQNLGRWLRHVPLLLILALLMTQNALAAPSGDISLAQTSGDTNGWSNFIGANGPPSESILSLHRTADGTLWVGTTAGIGIRTASGQWTTFSMDDGLAGNRVTAFATVPTNPQLHWVATNGGATLIDDGGDPANKEGFRWITYGKRDGMLDHRLSSIAIGPNNEIWFGLSYITEDGETRIGNGISVVNTNGTPFDKTDDAWRSYTMENSHLSTDVIYKIEADAAGVIWVATQSGLNAYANDAWALFSTEQGLPSNAINTFVIGDNQLWLGTSAGFGLLQHQGTLTNSSDDVWIQYPSLGLNTDSVSALALDENGFLWAGYFAIQYDYYGYYADEVGGVVVMDLNETPADPSDDLFLQMDPYKVGATSAIAADGAGAWLAANPDFIHATYVDSPVGSEQLELSTEESSTNGAGRNVRAVASLDGLGVVLATDGSCRLLIHNFTPHNPHDDQWYEFWDCFASTLATDQQNRIWAGSDGSLQVIDFANDLFNLAYESYTSLIYDELSGLRFGPINKIAVDDQGRGWIAHGSYVEGGLTLLSVGESVSERGDDQMATFTAQNSGLPGVYITAVAPGNNNDVWVGGMNGAAHLEYGDSPFARQDDAWTSFNTQNSGLTDNHIRDIAVDAEGNVWFALAIGGVNVYTADGQWIAFTESDGLVFGSVNVVLVDQLDRVWFGTDGEGISVLDHKGTPSDKSDDLWTTYGPSPILPNGYVQALTEDNLGQVWVGNFGGGLSVKSNIEFKSLYMPLIMVPYSYWDYPMEEEQAPTP
ncbi:MAG: two-component regulator propeller domain-containing protein [Caldilineaceae bacterium]